jgi:hypothetical protein
MKSLTAFIAVTAVAGVTAVALLGAVGSDAPADHLPMHNWETNLEKRAVDLDEIRSGGPPKDGIPSIDEPQFVSPSRAERWLGPKEPVMSLVVDEQARAYPLQILIFHEIANDRVGGVPVAATFCPLCYTAIVFDRRVDGRTLEFGVSGFLRHSDLVMYDREAAEAAALPDYLLPAVQRSARERTGALSGNWLRSAVREQSIRRL